MLAMGFLGPESAIVDQLELEQDPRSNISTPNGHYKTSLDKVFAAGGQYDKNNLQDSNWPLCIACFV